MDTQTQKTLENLQQKTKGWDKPISDTYIILKPEPGFQLVGVFVRWEERKHKGRPFDIAVFQMPNGEYHTLPQCAQLKKLLAGKEGRPVALKFFGKRKKKDSTQEINVWDMLE